jgi:hypothetical protein
MRGFYAMFFAGATGKAGGPTCMTPEVPALHGKQLPR